MTGRERLRQALRRHLEDPRVVLLGEAMGCHGVTEGFPAGPGLLRTPLSEEGAIGIAIGLALGGRRPVVELVDPAGLRRAADALADLAGLRARSGGAWSAPVVIRAPFAEVAVPDGIRVVVASTASDLVGMLDLALAGDEPVVILEAAGAFDDDATGPVAPLGAAVVRRAGTGVTVLAVGDGVAVAMAAGEGAEVLDLRALQPLDVAAIGESVRRTGRAILLGSGASPLLAALNEAFLSLESPPAAVPPAAGPDAVARAIRDSIHY